ncbi:MAG: hypothetical protein GXO75_15455 [Calditrichaeota bacterium]|nr:hypothetical protein [Calditrichota bacterium]
MTWKRKTFSLTTLIFFGFFCFMAGWSFYGYAVNDHPDNMNFIYSLMDLITDISGESTVLSGTMALLSLVAMFFSAKWRHGK